MYGRLVSKLNSIFPKDNLEKFFYGPYYPIYVALFVTLSFATNAWFFGLLIISLTATIIFLRFEDVSPIFPLLFMVVLVFRDYAVMGGITGYLILTPPAIAFILKFFIHPIKNFKPGKLLLPLLGVSTALFLSGILSKVNFYIDGLVIAFTIGPVLIVIYLFFSTYLNPPDGFDIKKYLTYILVIVGLTTFSHLLIYRLHNDLLKDGSFVPFFVGWGNVNCAATLLLLSVASCWYLITQVKNIIPFFIMLVLLYLGVLLTNSDGVTGICLIFAPILAFFAYQKINRYNRPTYIKIIIVVVSILVIASVATILFYGIDSLILALKPHFSDSSRTMIYQEALDLFSQYPVFGAGLGYGKYEPEISLGIILYNFHSVIFHVLATMGMIGIIAYVFYYLARFKILMHKNTCFNLFMTMAFIMFECYAFIDTAEFNAIPLMSTLTVLFVVVELTNKKSNDEPLPLLINYYNKIIF
ncbi:MAG: O-antigen ligase family protein [Clostridia bacterium]|nr:O-antigen ligase family protein [Clostridia bacterium]